MTARRRHHLALVLGAALGAGLPTPAAAQAAYSGSVTFLRSRADGTTRNDAIYVVNGFDAPIGHVRVSVTVPVLAQQMPTATDAVSAAATNWVTGLGDVYVRADAPLSGVGSGRLATSVNGSVKLPTADAARGLGSGETDVTVGFAVSSMRGRHSVLADVSFGCWATRRRSMSGTSPPSSSATVSFSIVNIGGPPSSLPQPRPQSSMGLRHPRRYLPACSGCCDRVRASA